MKRKITRAQFGRTLEVTLLEEPNGGQFLEDFSLETMIFEARKQ